MRTAVARWRARERQDAGITMIEMVVSMAIMMVLMVLFTTAVAQMYRTYNKVDATNQAQEQVNNAFLRLDKEIRYANAVSVPLVGATTSAVEYQLSIDNVITCVQLRLRTDTGLLQRRAWPDADSPSASWATLITGVKLTPASPGTVPAFTRLSATDAQNYQRLRLNFTTVGGGAAASTTRLTDITFTALNTTKSADLISNLCADGRSGL